MMQNEYPKIWLIWSISNWGTFLHNCINSPYSTSRSLCLPPSFSNNAHNWWFIRGDNFIFEMFVVGKAFQILKMRSISISEDEILFLILEMVPKSVNGDVVKLVKFFVNLMSIDLVCLVCRGRSRGIKATLYTLLLFWSIHSIWSIWSSKPSSGQADKPAVRVLYTRHI